MRRRRRANKSSNTYRKTNEILIAKLRAINQKNNRFFIEDSSAHRPKNNSARTQREKAVRKCPGRIQGVSWTVPTVSRERPESIWGAPWGVPRMSRSVPGASPERPRSVPMRPRSLRRHSGAILERFGFDFSLPGRFSEPSWAIFALIFLAPSFACAASTTR